MKKSDISYHKGKFKYQLANDYVMNIGFSQASGLKTEFVELAADGKLTVKSGFAWDGVTGLAFDTRNFMRASLVHDALFLLLRHTGENLALHERADDLFLNIAKKDGVNAFRARLHYTSLYVGRKLSLLPGKQRSVHTAP